MPLTLRPLQACTLKSCYASTHASLTHRLRGCGRWGIARHFHYLPEIMASFFWTAPALFSHPLPYFYVFYLTILLFDRARR